MARKSPTTISVAPGITLSNDALIASSCSLWAFLIFGLYLRQVIVDRVSETVTINQRFFWLLKLQKIHPFSDFVAVTYGYQDFNPFAFMSDTHEALDRFIVGLKSVQGEELKLFSFTGLGGFVNNTSLPDWWYGVENFDGDCGAQVDHSRQVVEALSRLMRKTVTASNLVPLNG